MGGGWPEFGYVHAAETGTDPAVLKLPPGFSAIRGNDQ